MRVTKNGALTIDGLPAENVGGYDFSPESGLLQRSALNLDTLQRMTIKRGLKAHATAERGRRVKEKLIDTVE